MGHMFSGTLSEIHQDPTRCGKKICLELTHEVQTFFVVPVSKFWYNHEEICLISDTMDRLNQCEHRRTSSSVTSGSSPLMLLQP